MVIFPPPGGMFALQQILFLCDATEALYFWFQQDRNLPLQQGSEFLLPGEDPLLGRAEYQSDLSIPLHNHLHLEVWQVRLVSGRYRYVALVP